MWCLIHLKMKEIEKGVKISQLLFHFFQLSDTRAATKHRWLFPDETISVTSGSEGFKNKEKEKEITIFAVLICFTFFP